MVVGIPWFSPWFVLLDLKWSLAQVFLGRLPVFSDSTNSPTWYFVIRSKASVEWPTSSKSSEPSMPEWSNSTSSPPGCSFRKLVTSYTLSCRIINVLSLLLSLATSLLVNCLLIVSLGSSILKGKFWNHRHVGLWFVQFWCMTFFFSFFFYFLAVTINDNSIIIIMQLRNCV